MTLAILALTGCVSDDPLIRPTPADRPDAPDTAGDTDTAPASACAKASWSWGAQNPVSTADASLVGPQPSSRAGALVMSPGDLDADGAEDLVVVAPGYDVDAGAAYFVIGGVARTHDQRLAFFPSVHGTPGAVVGNVAALGDIDADGLPDVGIDPAGEDGTRYLFRGRDDRWPADAELSAVADARLVVGRDGEADPWQHVWSADRFGDFDGDGVDDWFLRTVSDYGEAYVLRGAQATGDVVLREASSTWFDEEPVTAAIHGWADLDGDDRTDLLVRGAGATEVRVLFAGEAAGTLGGSFADASGLLIPSDRVVDSTVTLPDVNGDGIAELVVRYAMPAPSAGSYLFFGEPGWRGTRALADASVRVALGEWTTDPIGIEDLNGDGYAELGILVTEGDPLDGINVLYVYFGRSDWPSELTLADADVRITPFFTDGGEEVFVLSARVVQGDLDGDGLHDLILPLPYADEGDLASAGRIAVFYGRTTWPREIGLAEADVTFVGELARQNVGDHAVVADVDGDGCDDIVTAFDRLPEETEVGQVFVLFGQPR